MARDIDFSKPLDGDDAQYVRDRPWLARDAELSGETVVFADEADLDEGDFADDGYESWKKDDLHSEIKRRNEGREDDELIKPESDKNADLVAALVTDDEASAE